MMHRLTTYQKKGCMSISGKMCLLVSMYSSVHSVMNSDWNPSVILRSFVSVVLGWCYKAVNSADRRGFIRLGKQSRAFGVLTLIFVGFRRFIFTRKQVTSINIHLLFLICKWKANKLHWRAFEPSECILFPLTHLLFMASIKACAVWITCKIGFGKAWCLHSNYGGGGGGRTTTACWGPHQSVCSTADKGVCSRVRWRLLRSTAPLWPWHYWWHSALSISS